jgi:hypothetical protein
MKLMQQIEYLQADMDMISHDKNEQTSRAMHDQKAKIHELTNMFKQVKSENHRLV